MTKYLERNACIKIFLTKKIVKNDYKIPAPLLFNWVALFHVLGNHPFHHIAHREALAAMAAGRGDVAALVAGFRPVYRVGQGGVVTAGTGARQMEDSCVL